MANSTTLGDLVTALMDFFLRRFGKETAAKKTSIALNVILTKGLHACSPEVVQYLKEQLLC